jgi:NADPH:quinone reductase-like Zn-dependent oxidoreductase
MSPFYSTAPRPARGLTFEQAAAVPLAAVTALQGLRAGGIQPGQHVLIIGASGGVGTFAVRIARHLGAQVTGVCSTRHADVVRRLGAEQVIDYTKQDFTLGAARYDLILTPRAIAHATTSPAENARSGRSACPRTRGRRRYQQHRFGSLMRGARRRAA